MLHGTGFMRLLPSCMHCPQVSQVSVSEYHRSSGDGSLAHAADDEGSAGEEGAGGEAQDAPKQPQTKKAWGAVRGMTQWQAKHKSTRASAFHKQDGPSSVLHSGTSAHKWKLEGDVYPDRITENSSHWINPDLLCKVPQV